MTRAVVDIGTNTVRVLAIDSDGREVRRSHRVVSLGEGVDATGQFSEVAIDRTLRGLGELLDGLGPLWYLDAVATSATRDATNRDDFLDRAEQVLGVRPRVITGSEEAALSFLGATAGQVVGDHLVVDIGGGSTEVVMGAAIPTWAHSVDLGSVRMTERVLASRPAAGDEVDRALGWAMGRLAPVPVPDPVVPAFGVGGTFTSLAAIDADLPAYDRTVVHGWSLSAGAAEALVDRLARLTVGETEAIPSLDPARAPVLLAGAVIVLAVVWHLRLPSIEVRETDLLDALLTLPDPRTQG